MISHRFTLKHIIAEIRKDALIKQKLRNGRKLKKACQYFQLLESIDQMDIKKRWFMSMLIDLGTITLQIST